MGCYSAYKGCVPLSHSSLESYCLAKLLTSLGISHMYARVSQAASRSETRVPRIPQVLSRGRSYARSMYSRLSPALKEEYAAMVEGYLTSKWLVEASLVPTPSPPAQIFLIPPASESKESRLVIDFRELNKVLPCAGAGGESPALFHVLGLLRTESRETTLLCDCRSAFYNIRIDNLILVLESALGRYVSSRMGFGVVSGPCGLNGGLSQLIGEARSTYFGGLDQILL